MERQKLKHDAEGIKLGTKLFINEIERLQNENPEFSDFADAFEEYCAKRFSLGTAATTQRTGGKYDVGIDFFSFAEKTYVIGQCKTPVPDWLEAHSFKPRTFGPSGVDDLRSALRFLVGDSKLTANDRVKFLYSCIERDRGHEDLS